MKYRFYNGPVRTFRIGDIIQPLQYSGELMMAIDPSKTNCAVVFGDPGGDDVSILEMSGNNWSAGPVEDTTEYCAEIQDFLRQYLSGANLIKGGLEKAITKRGMMHHHSNMVLTEVRGSLLNFFYMEYGWRAEDVEINNWAWKKAILPDGYRGQDEKGSYRYFYQYLKDNRFVDYYGADVTDCMCIYWYMCRDTRNTYMIVCREKEKAKHKYKLSIAPRWLADSLQGRPFQYNPSFKLEENAIYYANRSKTTGVAVANIKWLSVDDIYKHAGGFLEIPGEEEIRLVVYPCWS